MALNNLEIIAEAYERIIRSYNSASDDTHYSDTIRNWYGAFIDNNQDEYDKLTSKIINQLEPALKETRIVLPEPIDNRPLSPIIISYYLGVLSTKVNS